MAQFLQLAYKCQTLLLEPEDALIEPLIDAYVLLNCLVNLLIHLFVEFTPVNGLFLLLSFYSALLLHRGLALTLLLWSWLGFLLFEFLIRPLYFLELVQQSYSHHF
jgi:hypothetical protein